MKHINMTPELYEYLLQTSVQEHPVLKALREETAKLPLANMQIAPEQAQFMQFLLRIIGAKNVLELGTFTGYSSLAMALALPEDGHLLTCDINEEWTEKAYPFWREAHQDNKIELRLGQALDTLEKLVATHKHAFDFIFIDADKTNYVNYYELSLQLVKPHGIIAIDNVLWSGKVVDKQENNGQTREIRRLNEILQHDKRVFTSLLPIADGLFLIQPK
ncbi:class I SAM-dependent methyltransferase [Legionella septentrionalis]|uniref:class I SAM-dependent methyltransferase n=1 Tax=Legionella septentrionalis TaxID=2498109 RepID=UPI000F8CDE0A|nr:class I SAM-dependent methyltransferase [Legionella septentrionalis]RUR10494.1 methyltransferase domain-containing protein [Legionella septentrionalis]